MRTHSCYSCALIAILTLTLVSTLPAPARGQTPQPAAAPRLAGVVLDASGAVVAGAEVRVEPLPSGAGRKALSDAQGRFTFDGLARGTYVVIVSCPGFAPQSTTVELGARSATPIEIRLEPSGVEEEVTVTATRIATPVSSIPNTVTILDEKVLERRVAASDDVASLLESTVPGFGPSMKKLTGRAESLRGRNPLYTINGVPQHTPLRDGERDGHTIDLDFVERIEVIHGANAIQGIGATGGIVNLVTKSPRSDGRWTQDVKLSVGNHDGFDDDGWTSKLSYLLGKRVGRLDFVAGGAVHKRGLFYDANGDAIGLYPTQGDIMDSTSRSLYGKAGYDFSPTRRLEVAVNHFLLSRDGDFVARPGDRAAGRLTTTVEGDPRPVVGDPAENEVTTVSIDFRDRNLLGGEAVVQAYVQDYFALFEGGAFTTFALTVGGPPFLDQSAITTDKLGAKLTYAMPQVRVAGFMPTIGLDVSRDSTAQILARTGRQWVPETVLSEVAPFFQLQGLVFGKLVLSGGLRFEAATLATDDYTTLPSSGATFVSGGSPSFFEVLPNIGAVYHLNRKLSVYGSFSEGFTMPDAGRVLRAVNVPGQDVDNLIDIEPVVAGNVEVGLDYRAGPVRFHTAYYRSVSERGSLLERNADDVFVVRRQPTTIDGVDVSAEVPLTSDWLVGGNFAWLRGRFDSNGDGSRDTDLDGLNIAPNRLNLFVQGAVGPRLTGRLQVSTLLDREFRGLSAPVGRDFSGYTTADLGLGYDTGAGIVRLGVENLFDKQYVIYFSQTDLLAANDTFFAGPGRTFTLSFERRF